MDISIKTIEEQEQSKSKARAKQEQKKIFYLTRSCSLGNFPLDSVLALALIIML
jgi:hypothetical protein